MSRLRAHANERADYLILIGVPPSDPVRWAEVSAVTKSTVTTADAGNYALDAITHFVVCYPNGQLVDYETRQLGLPAGTTGLDTAAHPDSDVITLDDLASGKRHVVVSYGPSTSRPDDINYYSTSLTNISDARIRVLRFGGYTPTKKGWKLSNATGAFYSDSEFINWYGLGATEWIAPGQTVADTNNYGGRPVLWAYYCETDDGKPFIVGEVLS